MKQSAHATQDTSDALHVPVATCALRRTQTAGMVSCASKAVSLSGTAMGAATGQREGRTMKRGRLKQFRKRLNLSREQAAAKCKGKGVTAGTIQNWELGKCSPTTDKLALYLRALNVRLEDVC